MYADIIYGVQHVYEDPDEKQTDKLVDLEDEYADKGCRIYIYGHRWTLTFGIPITSVTLSEPLFDMREVLTVIEPKKFTLRPDLEERWQEIMRDIPYELRDILSRPEFYVVWGS